MCITLLNTHWQCFVQGHQPQSIIFHLNDKLSSDYMRNMSEWGPSGERSKFFHQWPQFLLVVKSEARYMLLQSNEKVTSSFLKFWLSLKQNSITKSHVTNKLQYNMSTILKLCGFAGSTGHKARKWERSLRIIWAKCYTKQVRETKQNKTLSTKYVQRPFSEVNNIWEEYGII